MGQGRQEGRVDLSATTLRTVVDRLARLPVEYAAYIVATSCAAMARLAPPGPKDPVRDISPDTILVSRHGEIELASFRREEVLRRVNETTTSFGYTAPELAGGSPQRERVDGDSYRDSYRVEPDPRIGRLDRGPMSVFSFGVVLWELLAGARLFHSSVSDYQTIQLVREARVPAIDGLDPLLDAIVRRALARLPEDRYRGITELGGALAGYLDAREISVTAAEIAALVRGSFPKPRDLN